MSKITELTQQLRQLLESGAFPAGAHFPSEYELMERYGVSRITANKAVALLVAEKLLERGKRGSGTFVRRQQRFPRGWIAVLENFSHPYNMGMLAGAAQAAFAANCTLSVFKPEFNDMSPVLEKLADSDCMGVLVMLYGSGIVPENFPKPVIYLDRGAEAESGRKLHNVMCDNYGAAHEMMSQIIASGKQQIVVLGVESQRNRRERIAGFADALRENGFDDVEKRQFVMHHGSSYEVRQTIKKIFRSLPQTDFIATDSDDIVFRVMEVCRQEKIDCPGAIGLSGFGNVHGIADLHRIPSVDQHPWHIGVEAVKALLKIVSDGEPEEALAIHVPAEPVNTEYL